MGNVHGVRPSHHPEDSHLPKLKLYSLNHNPQPPGPPAPANDHSTFCACEFNHSGLRHLSGITRYLILWLACFTSHVKVYLSCSLWQDFLPFWSWTIFCYVYKTHFAYLFICQCTNAWVASFEYYKYSNTAMNVGVQISSTPCLLSISFQKIKRCKNWKSFF